MSTITKRKTQASLIMLVGLIVLLSSFAIPPSSGSIIGTSGVLGNNTVGVLTERNDPNAQSISYFTASSSTTITEVVAYIAGTTSSGNARVALYGDDDSFIDQSNIVSINAGPILSWVTFQFPTYTLDSGHTYGLAIMGDVELTFALLPNSGQRAAGPGNGNFATGFSSPFGYKWFDDPVGSISIYASGTATPTPSPTQQSVVTLGVSINSVGGTYQITAPIETPTILNGQTNLKYNSGTQITLTALPDNGYRFDHFTVTISNGAVDIPDNPWITNLGASGQVDIYFTSINSPTPTPTSTSSGIHITDGNNTLQIMFFVGLVIIGIGGVYYVKPVKIQS